MVKVNVNGNEYYMDEILKENLDKAKKKIKDDFDWVFLVDGRERSGKSVLAQQMAMYCDSSFNLNRVCFTAKEFKKAVINAEQYQAVVYDEAFTGLSSKDTMSKTNKMLVELMMEIGQKNLYVFIVLPTFFELTKYVALWRSCALIHVYMNDEFQRGYFAFYNWDLKIPLYKNGRDLYVYKGFQYNFLGRFTNHYVLDEVAYRAKKKKSLVKKDDKETEEELDNHIDWLFEWLMQYDDLPETLKQKILKMPPASYFRKKKQFNERLEEERLDAVKNE